MSRSNYFNRPREELKITWMEKLLPDGKWIRVPALNDDDVRILSVDGFHTFESRFYENLSQPEDETDEKKQKVSKKASKVGGQRGRFPAAIQEKKKKKNSKQDKQPANARASKKK